MIGTAIYSILSGNTALNTAVSGKIYPMHIPQGITLPAVVYTLVSNVPTITKDNQLKYDTRRVQISIFARSYKETEDIGAKVITALNNYKGTGSLSAIDHIVYDNDYDLFEEEAEVNHKAIDFKVIVKT